MMNEEPKTNDAAADRIDENGSKLDKQSSAVVKGSLAGAEIEQCVDAIASKLMDQLKNDIMPLGEREPKEFNSALNVPNSK